MEVIVGQFVGLSWKAQELQEEIKRPRGKGHKGMLAEFRTSVAAEYALYHEFTIHKIGVSPVLMNCCVM